MSAIWLGGIVVDCVKVPGLAVVPRVSKETEASLGYESPPFCRMEKFSDFFVLNLIKYLRVVCTSNFGKGAWTW